MILEIEDKRTKDFITLKKLITQYEMSNIVEGKSQKTIRWYSDILKSYSRYLKENDYNENVDNFNINVTREYILFLRSRYKYEGHPYTPKQDSQLSQQTIRGHVRGLKAFSSWLYREGYIKENRLKYLKIPKVPQTLITPLTDQEIEQITSSINKNSPTGFRNYTIFIMALDCGLRASGLAGLLINQIDLKGGYAKVLEKGSRERIVPIGEFVKMTVWNYINRIRPDPAIPGCDNLFLTTNGEPITTNTIKLIFSRLAKTSGVNRLHCHLCRHTFSINYLLNGGDMFSLREILGHSTLEMVNHYLHFTNSQLTAQHHKYSPMDRFYKKQSEYKRQKTGTTIS